MQDVNAIAWGLFPVYFADGTWTNMTAPDYRSAVEYALRQYPEYKRSDVVTVLFSSYCLDPLQSDWVDLKGDDIQTVWKRK